MARWMRAEWVYQSCFCRRIASKELIQQLIISIVNYQYRFSIFLLEKERVEITFGDSSKTAINQKAGQRENGSL